MADAILVKTCSKCQRTLPVESFHNAKRGKYGVSAVCKECHNAVGKSYMQNVRAGIIQKKKRAPQTVNEMKRCPQCSETMPLDSFPPDKNSKDGRYAFCRPCRIQYLRDKRSSKSQEDARRVALLNDRDKAEAKAGPEFKWCRKCQETKPHDKFQLSNGIIGPYCRDCLRVENRIRQREIRRKQRAEKGQSEPLVRSKVSDEYKKIKAREAVRKWQKSEKGKAKRREYERQQYVKERRRKYNKSEKGRQIHRKATAEWFKRLHEGTLEPCNIDDTTRDMIEMYEEGKSTYEIAEKYGTYGPAISYKLLRAGVKLRPKREYGFGKTCYGTDGHKLRSTLEQAVCNWMHRNNIEHIVEPLCPWCVSTRNAMRADFLVGDTYIEIWGLVGFPKYENRMAFKRMEYERMHTRLIEIYPADILDGSFTSLRILLK